MTSAAAAAKQKGNEAFGKGDFPTAVGHYTDAILADSSNPIYPLNRAAAYLKLGKFEDAERDCSAVIRLDPRNAKAWYRRAQARQGLDVWDDALADFQHVLTLEPTNELVKQDIGRVQFLIKNGKKPTRRAPTDVLASQPTPPALATPSPRRRRVPIAIVDDDAPSEAQHAPSQSADLLAPVSTRKLTSPAPTAPPPPSSSAKSSSASATSAATSPSRAGGGIFRRDGSHKLVGKPDETTPETSSPTANGSETKLNVDILPQDFAEMSVKATQAIPTSMYAFDRNWMALKTPQSRWQYLRQISPESLPTVFKTSLDTALLSSLIQTFHAILQTGVEPRAVKTYIVTLPQVSRWTTLFLFLSPQEKQLVKEIWDALPPDEDDAALRKVWGLL